MQGLIIYRFWERLRKFWLARNGHGHAHTAAHGPLIDETETAAQLENGETLEAPLLAETEEESEEGTPAGPDTPIRGSHVHVLKKRAEDRGQSSRAGNKGGKK